MDRPAGSSKVDTDRPRGQAYAIGEAAALLGLSVVAVRKRCQRGTLDATKDAGGDWVVYLDRPAPSVSSQGDTPEGNSRDDALVAELRLSLADARAERDRLLTLLEREQGLAAMHARRVLELEDTQSVRPWWRRVFG